MRFKSKTSAFVLVVAAFLAGVFFTTAGANLFPSDASLTEASHAAALDHRAEAPVRLGSKAVDLEEAFIQVAETINPTVVQIHSEKVVRQQFTNPFEGTPWENFFNAPGGDRDREFRSQALGSGVIIRPDGYIITNNHVIDGADELEVKLFDGEFYEATVVGSDPASDLAVIKIDAEDLPAITFGDIGGVRVGQWVLAFGSPLSEDLGNTVTAGIVSAMGRTSANLSRLNTFAAFIQTDAAINPGNSGGPLVNLEGQLIGINSAIFSRSGGYQGIGFAIPVDVVKNVTDQLIESGSVRRGYLGVLFGRVSPALAEAWEVPRGAALVSEVQPGTPADEAGLREGDVIVAVDGQELRDNLQLRTIIGNKHPGDTVQITYVRDGERHTTTVTLGTRPDELTAENEGPRRNGKENHVMKEDLGFEIRNLTPATVERLGLSDEDVTGVLVVNIDENSDAFREAELRQYDIITEIDRKPVRNAAEFREIYDDIEPGKTFIVRVARVTQGGQVNTFFTALTKPEK
jgi:serine protease Do